MEQARRKGGLAGKVVAVATNQVHPVMMGLVEDGDDNGNTIYILGRANHFLLL